MAGTLKRGGKRAGAGAPMLVNGTTLAAIKWLRASGLTWEQIARKTGFSRMTVIRAYGRET